MKKTINLFGFLATFMLSTGVLFKMMHWPFANILLVLAYLLLNFGFLPLFFFKRNSKQEIKSN